MDILKQIRDAYKYIKDNKLIHGNIKPTNILVDEKDKLIIKLTDFLICSKNSKHLLNDEFIAPEITFEEIKPNIISDIYSIGAIMKLLIEKAESSTDTYSKLMQDCLQIDSNKRIKFGIFKFHSYFTSIFPVYKLYRGNLLLNIRLFLHLHLHQRKRYNFILQTFILFRMFCNIIIQRKLH